MKTRKGTIAITGFFLLIAGSTIPASAQQGKAKGHDKGRDNEPAQVRGNGHDNAPGQIKKEQRLSDQEQQRRIAEERQRAAQYQARLDQQVRLSQQHAAQLQQQKRMAQYRVQQEYQARLRQQQAGLRMARDYQRDPYYYTPPSYQYRVGGVTRQTNEYGVAQLKQAVNYGYQEGYRAGQADHQDRARFDYRDTYPYQDANYGYNGLYVAQTDYNAYFREGFQRGYDDGYYTRNQYGTTSGTNGTALIVGSILTAILGLTAIH